MPSWIEEFEFCRCRWGSSRELFNWIDSKIDRLWKKCGLYIHFAHWEQNCQKCSGAPATPWLSGKMTKTDVAYNSKVVGGRWSFKKNFVRSYFFFRVHFIVHFTSQRIISATKVVVKGLISVPHCPFIESLFLLFFYTFFCISICTSLLLTYS